MVLLGYTLQTKGSIDQVFAYFAKFENISQWDLNVKYSKVLALTEQKVGSTYEVVSEWKGKETTMVYHMKEYENNKRIYLEAQNGQISAADELIFEERNGGTLITYNANIVLRHVLWLFTPLVRKDFEELAKRAEKGMKEKCEQLWP